MQDDVTPRLDQKQRDRVSARVGVIAGLTFAGVIVACIAVAAFVREVAAEREHHYEWTVSPDNYSLGEKAIADLEKAYSAIGVQIQFAQAIGAVDDDCSKLEAFARTEAEKQLAESLRTSEEWLNACEPSGRQECDKMYSDEMLKSQLRSYRR